MDFAASEWYSSDQTRAMLTISLSIDVLPHLTDADSDSYSSFWFNSSWVGISQNKRQLLVIGYYETSSSTTILTMIYTPNTGKVEYMPIKFTPAISDSVVELVVQGIYKDNGPDYKENNILTIYSVLQDILE